VSGPATGRRRAADGDPRVVHGDRRRQALLSALDDHLRGGRLDDVNVADISRRAGVTRSAFYFYFESKADAVAALMAEMYDDAFAAAAAFTGDGTVPERIRAAIHGVFASWDRHRHVFAAMLDARAESATARERWDADREAFVPVVADIVREERAAGRAPDGPDADVLAGVLLDLVDRAVERIARGAEAGERCDPATRERHAEAVVTVWLRAIFGHDPGSDA
jgi:AcrR family transcriptional regulator